MCDDECVCGRSYQGLLSIVEEGSSALSQQKENL